MVEREAPQQPLSYCPLQISNSIRAILAYFHVLGKPFSSTSETISCVGSLLSRSLFCKRVYLALVTSLAGTVW